MQITHNNILPGMITKDVEFFAVEDGNVNAIHDGKVHGFDELPSWIHGVLKKISGENCLLRLKKFAYENFGGLDHTPDITSNGRVNFTESLDFTKGYPVGNGETLTQRECEYILLLPREDQEIANTLNLSCDAVKSRRTNCCRKIGVKNKVELALWASKKGLI